MAIPAYLHDTTISGGVVSTPPSTKSRGNTEKKTDSLFNRLRSSNFVKNFKLKGLAGYMRGGACGGIVVGASVGAAFGLGVASFPGGLAGAIIGGGIGFLLGAISYLWACHSNNT